MEQTAGIWERVATLPPGPDLACLLDGLPWEQVPNQHTPTVAQAWARQRAHHDAQLLLGLVHIARSVPVDDLDGVAVERAPVSYPSAVSEIAAALTLTPTAAGRELGLAEHLIDHLPLVFAALREGRIDRGRAWIFTEYLSPHRCDPEGVKHVQRRVPGHHASTDSPVHRRSGSVLQGGVRSRRADPQRGR